MVRRANTKPLNLGSRQVAGLEVIANKEFVAPRNHPEPPQANADRDADYQHENGNSNEGLPWLAARAANPATATHQMIENPSA
jgi:hypothetical protein